MKADAIGLRAERVILTYPRRVAWASTALLGASLALLWRLRGG